MSHQSVLANLNLYAVLQNLEDLVVLDREMAAFCADWNITVQFVVRGGPKAFVAFKNGVCAVGRGMSTKSDLKLYFNSAAHCNKMFEGAGMPIPYKGFTKLYFLATKFSKLTERLEYYVKPTDELLADARYREINTTLTLHTAAYAAEQLALNDPVCKAIYAGMGKGAVLIKVLPDGPAVTMDFDEAGITVKKADCDKPMASMLMRDMEAANDFFNGKMDIFSAIAGGKVQIWGQTPLLDNLGLILDRVPQYLE